MGERQRGRGSLIDINIIMLSVSSDASSLITLFYCYVQANGHETSRISM